MKTRNAIGVLFFLITTLFLTVVVVADEGETEDLKVTNRIVSVSTNQGLSLLILPPALEQLWFGLITREIP